jgi:23S rRNA (guanosine2251-2'-O)-methyltransferase
MRNNADKHFASAKCKNGSQAGKQKDKTELLIGFHSVYEALKAQRRSFYRIVISKQRTGPQPAKITELAQEHKLTVENIPSKALDQLTNNAKHQGFAALTSHFPVHTGNELIQKINKANPPNLISDLVSGLILVLENIEDPHNLGALIRTAICAGVDFILIPGNRAAGPSPTVSAISAGAMEHAQIGIMTNTASSLKALKDKGVWIFGLDAGAKKHLFETDLKGSVALVIGGENKGIRPLVKKECDFLVSLPNLGPINSLNASVAGGIAMYEVLRQKHGE